MYNLYNFHRSFRTFAATVIVAAGLMAGNVVQAQTCYPLHIEASAALSNVTFDQDGNLTSASASGSGIASHLGAVTATGVNYLYPPVEGIARLDGSGTYTAANGDQMWVNFDNTAYDLNAGISTGTYVITGGTGRFTGASGSAPFTTRLASSEVPTLVISAEGTICY